MKYNEWISTKKYGKFKVLKKVDTEGGTVKNRFLIEFETGNTKEVSLESIYRKNIRNEYYPIRYGVACIGNVKNATRHFLYKRWECMLNRCYNKSISSYKNYGAKGVTVCERWLCFENYIEDVVTLSGYVESDIKSGLLELDKDIINREALTYSPETCKWVTKSEQLIESNGRREYDIFFKATRITDKYEEVSNSIAKFAKKYNLNGNCICSCLRKYKYYKTHKGWIFELISC